MLKLDPPTNIQSRKMKIIALLELKSFAKELSLIMQRIRWNERIIKVIKTIVGEVVIKVVIK